MVASALVEYTAAASECSGSRPRSRSGVADRGIAITGDPGHSVRSLSQMAL